MTAAKGPSDAPGPPFDPRMTLPGLPDDWRVLWCFGCGYAVIWDRSVEDDDWDIWHHVVHKEAAPHDCPALERTPA